MQNIIFLVEHLPRTPVQIFDNIIDKTDGLNFNRLTRHFKDINLMLLKQVFSNIRLVLILKEAVGGSNGGRLVD